MSRLRAVSQRVATPDSRRFVARGGSGSCLYISGGREPQRCRPRLQRHSPSPVLRQGRLYAPSGRGQYGILPTLYALFGSTRRTPTGCPEMVSDASDEAMAAARSRGDAEAARAPRAAIMAGEAGSGAPWRLWGYVVLLLRASKICRVCRRVERCSRHAESSHAYSYGACMRRLPDRRDMVERAPAPHRALQKERHRILRHCWIAGDTFTVFDSASEIDGH